MFDGPVANLLSTLSILTEILSRRHAKGPNKPWWFQSWHFFIGRFESDGVVSTALKELISNYLKKEEKKCIQTFRLNATMFQPVTSHWQDICLLIESLLRRCSHTAVIQQWYSSDTAVIQQWYLYRSLGVSTELPTRHNSRVPSRKKAKYYARMIKRHLATYSQRYGRHSNDDVNIWHMFSRLWHPDTHTFCPSHRSITKQISAMSPWQEN